MLGKFLTLTWGLQAPYSGQSSCFGISLHFCCFFFINIVWACCWVEFTKSFLVLSATQFIHYSCSALNFICLKFCFVLFFAKTLRQFLRIRQPSYILRCHPNLANLIVVTTITENSYAGVNKFTFRHTITKKAYLTHWKGQHSNHSASCNAEQEAMG